MTETFRDDTIGSPPPEWTVLFIKRQRRIRDQVRTILRARPEGYGKTIVELSLQLDEYSYEHFELVYALDGMLRDGQVLMWPNDKRYVLVSGTQQ